MAVNAKTIEAREREAQALALRRKGRSYDAIAAEAGYANRSVAWKAVMRAYGRLAAEVKQEAEIGRALDLQRLDAALVAISAEVEAGDLDAIDRLVRIIALRARLLGLEAPTKVATTDPTGEYERGSDAIAELERRFTQLCAAHAEQAPAGGQTQADP